jgi:hypothetical protein
MMQQKIEGQVLPSLHTAACDMETMGLDLDDVVALLFALGDRSGDYELDRRAIRGAMLAVERLRDQANAKAAQLLEAHRVTAAQ